YDENGEVVSIRLWDPATGKERRHIRTRGGLVRSLAFTADGKRLISGGGESIIRLWDVATGEERAPAAGHDAVVWWLALAPDGKTLAYSGKDIGLYDMARGREVGRLAGHHWSAAFSPDGKTLAGGHGVKAINLWDVADRRLARRLEIYLKPTGGNWVT